MAKVYRNICTYIWLDDKFPFAPDDVQLVWFHLFTNPLSTPLGIFRASLAGLAEEKNRNGKWPTKRYFDAIADAKALGLIDHDQKAMVIAFPNYFSDRYPMNHPTSINQVISWSNIFNDLPESPLKVHCYQRLFAIIDAKADAIRDAFLKTYRTPKGLASPIPNPNPNPNPNPILALNLDLNSGIEIKNKTLGENARKSSINSDKSFDEFWSAYPHKKSKEQARKTWAKLKIGSELFALIMAGVERAKNSDDWRKRELKHIPYPSTWLNAHGWEDEYDSPKLVPVRKPVF